MFWFVCACVADWVVWRETDDGRWRKRWLWRWL